MKEKNESNFENHKGFSRRRGTMRNFVVFVIAATVVIVGTLYPKKRNLVLLFLDFLLSFLLFNSLIHAASFSRGIECDERITYFTFDILRQF